MLIRLDRTLCDGFGVCADECPSVIELDEFGYAQLLTTEVPEGDESKAQSAADVCPKKAITLTD